MTEIEHAERVAKAARAFTRSLAENGVLKLVSKHHGDSFEAYRELDAALSGWETRNYPPPGVRRPEREPWERDL